MSVTSFLDLSNVRVLERMRLKPRRNFVGRVRGERLSRQKGTSLEFRDYREYTEGDDLRHIDWNVLARLGIPIVKTYQDEEDLPVYLLVDCSLSMDYGEPNKFEYAKQVATGFALMAVCGGDSVCGIGLGASQVRTKVLRGRKGSSQFVSWLQTVKPDGKLSIAHSLKKSRTMLGRPGVVVLITDGMDQELSRTISFITALGHELWLIQVLSPFELNPQLEGDLRMVDLESGRAVEITANESTLAEYGKNLANHNQLIRQMTLKSGGRHTVVSTDISVSKLFTEDFVKLGWIE